MSRFKYRERSAETVSARSRQSGGNFDSYLKPEVSFLKVKEGLNELRIIPPTWDPKGPFGDNWGIEIWVHRDIGPDNDVYLCIDEMRKLYGVDHVPKALGNCPLCAARADADDEEQIKALKPGKQILAYVINRADEKAGPLVWRMGWQLERDIQLRSIDKQTNAVIPIDHPDRGYDISFTREGAGLKTKYVGVDVARRDSPMHDSEKTQDKWLQFAQDNPLPDMLNFYDEQYIAEVYRGKRAANKGDAEEDDRRAPTRTGRGRAAEPDEEDDRRSTRSRGRAAEPDEEEAPPRRGRVADVDDELPDDKQMARNTERLRGRAAEPADEEDAPPPRRRAAEPADDEPAPRRRAARDEEEAVDEPAPRRRRSEPEDEEEAPRRRRAEPEEEAPTRRRSAPRDEEEDEPPARGGSAGRAQESLSNLRRGKR